MPDDSADPLDQHPPKEPQPTPDVPMARPVAAPEQWFAPETHVLARPRGLSAWSAFWQLIGIIPVYVFAAWLALTLLRSVLGITDPRWQQILGTLFIGCCLVGFSLILAQLGGETPSALGWRMNNFALESYIGTITAIMILIGLAILSFILLVFYPELTETDEARKAIEQAIPRMSVSTTLIVLTMVSIWEEGFFRGFLLTRLHAIFKRWWLVVPLGAAIFATGHDYQGKLAMVFVAGLGIAFGILFVWRKSLISCIVCHTIFNFVILMLIRFAPRA